MRNNVAEEMKEDDENNYGRDRQMSGSVNNIGYK